MYRILTEVFCPIDNEISYIHEVIRKSSFESYLKFLSRYHTTFKILEKEETSTVSFTPDPRASAVTRYCLKEPADRLPSSID